MGDDTHEAVARLDRPTGGAVVPCILNRKRRALGERLRHAEV